MAVYHRGGVKGRLLGYVFLAACLAACGGPASGGSSETAADALNSGLAAHAAGKLDEAVAAYFTTLSKDPKNQFAYYNLGEIAQRQSRFVAAESYYRIALEMDPKMVSALFNLAIVRTNAGATNEAIALYRQAIAVDANYAAAHFNLGLLLRQIGQTAEAQTELATAQKLDPTLVAPSPSASPIRQASPSPTRRRRSKTCAVQTSSSSHRPRTLRSFRSSCPSSWWWFPRTGRRRPSRASSRVCPGSSGTSWWSTTGVPMRRARWSEMSAIPESIW